MTNTDAIKTIKAFVVAYVTDEWHEEIGIAFRIAIEALKIAPTIEIEK